MTLANIDGVSTGIGAPRRLGARRCCGRDSSPSGGLFHGKSVKSYVRPYAWATGSAAVCTRFLPVRLASYMAASAAAKSCEAVWAGGTAATPAPAVTATGDPAPART